MNSFIRETDICKFCHRGEMIPLDDEGVLICNECAVHIPYLIENENLVIKNLRKKFVFMLIKKLIILRKFLLNFKEKRRLKFPMM